MRKTEKTIHEFLYWGREMSSLWCRVVYKIFSSFFLFCLKLKNHSEKRRARKWKKKWAFENERDANVIFFFCCCEKKMRAECIIFCILLNTRISFFFIVLLKNISTLFFLCIKKFFQQKVSFYHCISVYILI